MDALLVIFDLDGTIIDVGEKIDFDKLLVQALVIMRVPIPNRAERDLLWKSGKDHREILASWGIRDAKEFWDTFDGIDFEARTREIESGGIRLYADAQPALEALKRSNCVHVAGFTNTAAKLARYQVRKFGLDAFFEYLLALDMDGHDQSTAKPEPDGIYTIQQKIHGACNRDVTRTTVLVGDSEIDVIAACRAGIPCIQIVRDPARQSPLPGACAVIDSLVALTVDFLRATIALFHRRICVG